MGFEGLDVRRQVRTIEYVSFIELDFHSERFEINRLVTIDRQGSDAELRPLDDLYLEKETFFIRDDFGLAYTRLHIAVVRIFLLDQSQISQKNRLRIGSCSIEPTRRPGVELPGLRRELLAELTV